MEKRIKEYLAKVDALLEELKTGRTKRYPGLMPIERENGSDSISGEKRGEDHKEDHKEDTKEELKEDRKEDRNGDCKEKHKESLDGASVDDIIAEHLIQIGFFSHERLIHLIVTALFAILEVISLFMSLVTGNIAAIVLTIAILVLLVPYVRHYYILENSVQRMYAQYDIMLQFKSLQTTNPSEAKNTQ